MAERLSPSDPRIGQPSHIIKVQPQNLCRAAHGYLLVFDRTPNQAVQAIVHEVHRHQVFRFISHLRERLDATALDQS